MNAFVHPIGNQTAYSAAHWLDPFHFALHHRMGVFEWFSDQKGTRGWDFALCDAACRKGLAHQAEAAGMVFTVHAPWDSQPTTDEGRARIRASLEFARDVGARLVVIHLPGSEAEADWIAGMEGPLGWAREAGILLALENTVTTSPADCERVFAALIRNFGSGAPIGLCFDMGHANVCAATRHDYVGFLDTLSPNLRIVHAHLHENWGYSDDHLVLFTGPSAHDTGGIGALLTRLLGRGYRGAFVLEQWPEPPELLVTAAERLRGLLAGR